MTNGETDPNQTMMPLPWEVWGSRFRDFLYIRMALKNPWEFRWTQKLWVQHPPLPSPYFLTTDQVQEAHLGFRCLICKMVIIFLFKTTLTRARIPASPQQQQYFQHRGPLTAPESDLDKMCNVSTRGIISRCTALVHLYQYWQFTPTGGITDRQEGHRLTFRSLTEVLQ